MDNSTLVWGHRAQTADHGDGVWFGGTLFVVRAHSLLVLSLFILTPAGLPCLPGVPNATEALPVLALSIASSLCPARSFASNAALSLSSFSSLSRSFRFRSFLSFFSRSLSAGSLSASRIALLDTCCCSATRRASSSSSVGVTG